MCAECCVLSGKRVESIGLGRYVRLDVLFLSLGALSGDRGWEEADYPNEGDDVKPSAT